ncbi:MAG: exodeoxyribonuclease VII large subunit, partial [Acidimicrobiales bacterium]
PGFVDTEMTKGLTEEQREQVVRRSVAIARCAPRVLEDAWSALAVRADRVGPLVTATLDHAEESLASWRRLVAAYDVERQLERGYTLTLDASGRAVRRVSQVGAGDELTTRFADGSARSVVAAVTSAAGAARMARDETPVEV